MKKTPSTYHKRVAEMWNFARQENGTVVADANVNNTWIRYFIGRIG